MKTIHRLEIVVAESDYDCATGLLALDGSVVPGNEGITDDDIEVCIANLGRLGSTGMKEADKVILDIMLKKS